jgi:hypothetical protein
MIDPKALQYGALGLLFGVLSGIFILARSIFDRMFTQGDENLKFVRDQIEKANAAREGQLKAWIDAYKDQIAVSVQTAEALSKLHENLEEILFTLKQMNGGNK